MTTNCVCPTAVLKVQRAAATRPPAPSLKAQRRPSMTLLTPSQCICPHARMATAPVTTVRGAGSGPVSRQRRGDRRERGRRHEDERAGGEAALRFGARNVGAARTPAQAALAWPGSAKPKAARDGVGGRRRVGVSGAQRRLARRAFRKLDVIRLRRAGRERDSTQDARWMERGS